AAVAVGRVPVVAQLAARRDREAVAAPHGGLRRARRAAAVAVLQVAVVAALAGIDDAVAAARGSAVGAARIGSRVAVRGAVVAELAEGRADAVPARRRTGSAERRDVRVDDGAAIARPRVHETARRLQLGIGETD